MRIDNRRNLPGTSLYAPSHRFSRGTSFHCTRSIMRSIITALTLAICANADAANAGDGYSAQDLENACRVFAFRQKSTESWAEGFDQGLCVGVVYSALNAGGKLGAQNLRHCAPGSVTYRQGMRVVIKYMEDHPEELDQPLLVLTLRSFRLSWPCKN